MVTQLMMKWNYTCWCQHKKIHVISYNETHSHIKNALAFYDVENMKIYILIAAVLLFASCETFQSMGLRFPASVKQKHYIISIHGLGGKPDSLGELMPVLDKHLSQIDPSTDVIIKNFSYSTGAKDADVERFVSEFENFLIKQIPAISADSADRISLVTHSQGGLVGTLWYLKSINGVDLKQKSYAEKISSFVTLGVPFWGSKTTFVLKDFVPYEFLQSMIFSGLKISDQEVTDITASSQKIYDYFKRFTTKNYVNSYYDPRMINIIGVVPDQKNDEKEKSFFSSVITNIKDRVSRVLDRRLNVGIRWESDQAVNVASGRLGFHFYSDSLYQQILERKPDPVQLENFDYSRFFKTDPQVVFTEAVHSYASNLPKYAIAQVPESCYNPYNCEHPAYVHILKHVAYCDSPKSTCDKINYERLISQLTWAKKKLTVQTSEQIKAEMRTFNLGMEITLPKNFVPPADLLDAKTISKYLVVNYMQGHNVVKNLKVDSHDGLIKSHPAQTFEIRLGRYREWASRIVNYSAEKNQLNIQLTGSIHMKNKQALDVNKRYPLRMTIQIPGLKTRKLVIPLQPTYTTFLDLQLD